MKTITYKAYIAFLTSLGLTLLENKEHQKWDFAEKGSRLIRPITVRTKDKDIPELFLQTNRRTLVDSGVFVNNKAHDAALAKF